MPALQFSMKEPKQGNLSASENHLRKRLRNLGRTFVGRQVMLDGLLGRPKLWSG